MQQNRDGEPKLFKTFGRFSSALLLSVLTLHAGSFEDYKKAQNESFKKYKDERDAEFNNYLKAQWKAYKEFSGESVYEKPKPTVLPEAKYVAPLSVGPKIVIQLKATPQPIVEQKPIIAPKSILIEKPIIIEKPPMLKKPVAFSKPVVAQKPIAIDKPLSKKPVALQKPVVAQKPLAITKPLVVSVPAVSAPVAAPIIVPPIVAKPQEVISAVQAPTQDINFLFYGSPVSFATPFGLKQARFYPNTQEGIASFFDKAATSEYQNLVRDLQATKNELNLNDWGVYLLVNELSAKLFTSIDDVNLFSWFLLNKLGYSVKVGLANNHVVLLAYSKKMIYSTPSYTLDQKKYYALSFYNKSGVGALYTYNQDYPGSLKPLDLSIQSLPKLSMAKNSKTLAYNYQGQEVKIAFNYNQNIIDFMATYPQADYDTYFDAPIENESYVQIASGLKKYIDGQRASDAMNFVLSFVQHAFAYQTDDQQFKREKPMFAEETLYYNASDCEDRAALYGFLMKKLFNANIVGVKYSDHMATAIHVPLAGDSVNVLGERFVVADPTYINATVGQAMPQYKSVIPESFIVVKAK